MNNTELQDMVATPAATRGQPWACTLNNQVGPYPDVVQRSLCESNRSAITHRWYLNIVRSSWLDTISIIVTLVCCLIELKYSFCVDDRPNIEMWINICILGYVTVETFIKIMVQGLYGYEGTYLRSAWNWFDIIIYFALMLNVILDACDIHVPASEPLKILMLISKLPSMRRSVFRLSSILSMLGNILCLLMFFIHIFAVLGVQLWAGQLRYRCFLGEDVLKTYNVSMSPYYLPEIGDFICAPHGSGGMQRCSDVPPYRENGSDCTRAPPHHLQTPPANWHVSGSNCTNWHVFYNVCRPDGPNPNWESTSFDHIGYAWITTFQVITLKGWTHIMYIMMDTYSVWSFVFFLPLTFVGSFIIMNMCAVVIATYFANTGKRDSTEQDANAVTLWTQCMKLFSRLTQFFSRFQCNPASDSRQSETRVFALCHRFLRRLEVVVKGELFSRVFMLAIFANIVTMALEHHDQSLSMTRALAVCNVIFVVVFVVEMVLKILGLGWMYFIDGSNMFDFVIVIISFWEIATGAERKLSVPRSLRVLRFLRLIGFFPTRKRQLLVLVRTVKEATTLCCLLAFFMVIFSFLGMHLFGCTSEPQNEATSVRKNFDSLLWSMVTVFQIMTEDSWNLILYNAMVSTSPWAALYFVVVILFGRYVLLNILVGIVVQSFHDQYLRSCLQGLPPPEKTEPDINKVDGVELLCEDESVMIDATQDQEEEEEEEGGGKVKRPLKCTESVQRWFRDREDWCLFLLSPQNRWRVICKNVTSHKAFDATVLLCILLCCITMAMERPSIQPGSLERQILDISCYAFTVIFSLEMLLKVTALGLVFGRDNYCQSNWNIIDGIVVIVSWIDIIIQVFTSTKLRSLVVLKVLRLLRTLRPLSMISKSPKLKLAMEALFASVKVMGNVLLISCFFFFVYGIVGVQLFQGTFFHCVGQNVTNIANKSNCLSAEYHWVQKPYNFDNLLQALLSLFVMYSMDGWVILMHDGVNAVGVDQQPVDKYNPWMLIYFISFMVVSFILLDMFIGAMVETFHECQKKQKLSAPPGQETGPDVPPDQEDDAEELSPKRRCLRRFCKSRTLDFSITTVIIINVLMMALEHHNQPEYMDRVTEYVFMIFTIIMTVELLLKIAAFGPQGFIKSRWNLLDVFVVLVSIVSIVLSEMELEHVIPFNPGILRVCRMLRLSQVLKTKNIQVLLQMLVKTLSQIGNIGLLFIFFFFIYAVLGVELFGELECSVDFPCIGLHRYSSFENFGLALITLYKVCTGDGWSVILRDTLRDCLPGSTRCSSYLYWLSALFFASFTIIAQFVLANLVVAVIMQVLEDCMKEKEGQNSLVQRAPQSDV